MGRNIQKEPLYLVDFRRVKVSISSIYVAFRPKVLTNCGQKYQKGPLYLVDFRRVKVSISSISVAFRPKVLINCGQNQPEETSSSSCSTSGSR